MNGKEFILNLLKNKSISDWYFVPGYDYHHTESDIIASTSLTSSSLSSSSSLISTTSSSTLLISSMPVDDYRSMLLINNQSTSNNNIQTDSFNETLFATLNSFAAPSSHKECQEQFIENFTDINFPGKFDFKENSFWVISWRFFIYIYF